MYAWMEVNWWSLEWQGDNGHASFTEYFQTKLNINEFIWKLWEQIETMTVRQTTKDMDNYTIYCLSAYGRPVH